jgi:hypothetical protein
MSKKYKLITKYPSLPKTMEVGFEVEWSQDLNRYHHALTLDLFSKADVENFPSCWEEVGIKEFKILTQVKDGYLFDEVVEGDGISVCVASVVSKDNILKVKRLSDGEVFTLGDRVHFGENGIITKFNIILNTLLINIDYDKGLGNGYNNVGINAIKKRKIILTTEDGVDIFEGDRVASINKHTFLPRGYGRPVLNPEPNTFLYFSTKEKAEEYIRWNKPVLSMKDVKESVHLNSNTMITELIKIIKERIQLR